MNQLTFFKYATWGLLVLNIVGLTFFLLTKPRPSHRSSPHDFQAEIIETLQLDSQQVATFRKLAYDHRQNIQSINEQQQQLLPPYFESLSDPATGIDGDSILNQFQRIEREKIELTYQHFLDLKLMLDESQLPHFDSLIDRLVDRLLLEKGKNRPPRREDE